MRPLVTPQCLS
uniref:Uncharacterized protein n=1 Tax=Rhizophora mucronata TaxID=61149 RepID=A0A2P2JDQ4_RHIMU